MQRLFGVSLVRYDTDITYKHHIKFHIKSFVRRNINYVKSHVAICLTKKFYVQNDILIIRTVLLIEIKFLLIK